MTILLGLPARRMNNSILRDFAWVIGQIANEIQAPTRVDGRFDLRSVVEKAQGQRIQTKFGELRIEQDGVLVIIDRRFQKGHAGRNEWAVYAADGPEAQHEITELRLWAEFAIKKRIITPEQLRYGLSGTKLRAWMNDPSLRASARAARQILIQAKVYMFHQEGLLAEARAGRRETEKAQRTAPRRTKKLSPEEQQAAQEEFDNIIASSNNTDEDLGQWEPDDLPRTITRLPDSASIPGSA